MLIAWISITIIILALLTLLATKAWPIWVRWHRLRPYARSWQLFKLSYLIDDIYDTERTYRAAQQDRAKLTPNFALTYGEIPFITLVDVLMVANAQAGENFYDLGAGDGRAVMTALLLVPFAKVCGIEMLPTLYDYSQQYRQKWSQTDKLPSHFATDKVQFIHGDYFQVDFSDADIVYINATGLFGEDWDKLVEKFQQLKAHARIITTSRKLESPQFTLVDEAWRMMSWGLNRIYIYEKIH